MKSKSLIAALAVLGFAASASAQTVINITGATAFREAAHLAIQSTLTAGYTYGYTGTNLGNASQAIFKGTYPSNGTVTIRTSWSGSVAGIRAIVNQTNNVSYQPTTATTSVGGTASLATGTDATTANFISFSDCSQDNTPFNAVSLLGGPVGVAAFVPVSNATSRITDVSNTGYTNISSLQLRRLLGFGSVPLQLITGNSADAGVVAYWTGRQDTSGTRIITLSEMGIGSAGSVNQWRVSPLNNTTGIAVTSVQLWPLGDTANASTIYQADKVGNGGYASGAVVSAALQRTSSSGVTILDQSGGTIASNKEIALISVISAQEGNDIQTGGGKVLSYNGTFINPVAPTPGGGGGISQTDKDKIIKGQYTLWSYENLYYRDDIPDTVTNNFVVSLGTNVPANIGGNGVAISAMKVSRSSDGAIVVPQGLP